MRVRQLICEQKIIQSDTNWRFDDMQPRYSWIFERTKPIRGGWKWRSVTAESPNHEYVFLTQCHPGKDEWKAWLIVKTASGQPSLVSRLELSRQPSRFARSCSLRPQRA